MSTSTGSASAGTVALITGASGAIGAAIARLLATGGAGVVVTGRNIKALEAVARDVNATGGRAVAIPAELTDPGSVAALRRAAESELGPVELVAAAAGGGGRPTSLAALEPAEWTATLDRNLTTTFLTLREFVPPMVERGHGAVVTISSDAATTISGASSAYAAAKAAVLTLTRAVAAETAGRGVRVNAVAPGTVRTARIDALPSAVQDQLAAGHPQHRLGTVDDVASAVQFLLDEHTAGWITGHTLDLGARTLR
jgi:3-oxoacyl-[acyl-carrier protein] reductase